MVVLTLKLTEKILHYNLKMWKLHLKILKDGLLQTKVQLTVALDVTISDDLRKEGIARELVNRIQNLRKDSGFEVTDRIDVMLQKDENIVNAVSKNIEYIKAETLTEELEIIRNCK